MNIIVSPSWKPIIIDHNFVIRETNYFLDHGGKITVLPPQDPPLESYLSQLEYVGEGFLFQD